MGVSALLTLLAAVGISFANGANDNGKGVATLIGGRILHPGGALWLAHLATFVGAAAALVVGHRLMAVFSGRGLLPESLLQHGNVMSIVATAAAATVLLATIFRLPISTTHALTGALVGVSFAQTGTVVWPALANRFVLPLLLSPLVSAVAAYVLYRLLHRARLAMGVTKETCVCVGERRAWVPLAGAGAPSLAQQGVGYRFNPVGFPTPSFRRDGAPSGPPGKPPVAPNAVPDSPPLPPGAPPLPGVGDGRDTPSLVPHPQRGWGMRDRRLSVAVADGAVCRDRYQGRVVGVSAARLLDGMHVLSATLVSAARGMNDTPKLAALVIGGAAAWSIGPAVALIAVAMLAGGVILARRVAATLSERITQMNPGSAMTANAVAACLVLLATGMALPVSTTHVTCGALFGIGLAHGRANWRMVGTILLAWVVTLPLAAAVAWTLSTTL